MNDEARQAWDDGPPRDLEAEQLFLSAAIVEGGRNLHGVTGYHMHDPFHSWLLGRIRQHGGKCNLIGHVVRDAKASDWPGRKAAVWLVQIFRGRDGSHRSGLVANLPQYAARLKRVGKARTDYTKHQLGIVEATQWREKDLKNTRG